MLFSYKWIKEFVPGAGDAVTVADRLTMSGVEVEEVIKAGGDIKGVVTAEVVSVDKHPNADKLKLCTVKTGDETLAIVCGASNMKAGDKVALATPGARLPGGVKIKKSKIRGEVSHGMMCSEVELGLSDTPGDTSEGILILDRETPVGEDFVEAAGMADTLLEVAVLPNRADIMSIRGIAREIGAVTGAELKDTVHSVKESNEPIDKVLKVSIDATDLCPRYTARVIKGVKPGPSPAWLKNRIEALGIRSINNIVDITNYVMLELGQPLHAFDLDLLSGGELKVREARRGETIETIDNIERKLDEGMLVIADKKAPQAIAGIMGGARSAVHDKTVNIALESAWFDPASVRKTSKKSALASDSSYRFERGVDIDCVERALDRAAGLIAELAGGEILKGVAGGWPGKSDPQSIDFDLKRASTVLGMELSKKDVTGAFDRLGINWKDSGELIKATPPSYRRDITLPEDLYEEVARIVGYDRVPTVLPTSSNAPAVPDPVFKLRGAARAHLASAGFMEAINYSFVSSESVGRRRGCGSGAVDGAVELRNPLTDEQSMLRRSLLPSLMENLSFNLARKNEDVRLFEVGPVFTGKGGAERGGDSVGECWKVGGVMFGPRWAEGWSTPKEALDFFDLKGVVESLMDALGAPALWKAERLLDDPFFHPGLSASLSVGPAAAGVFGQIHPDISTLYDVSGECFAFELDFETLARSASEAVSFTRPPRFPESTRDVALFIDEQVPYGKLLESVKSIDVKNIEKVLLFDVYYGENNPEGKKGLALRVVYRSTERTLKTDEVDALHGKVTGELVERFGAELRV